MCIDFGRKMKLSRPIAAPKKTAEPAEVGSARKKEDGELFDGVPQLRVDRSATGGGAGAGGAGIRM